MTDAKDLIQEPLVTKGENPDPEYQRLIREYAENPFFDINLRPEEKEKAKKYLLELRESRD